MFQLHYSKVIKNLLCIVPTEPIAVVAQLTTRNCLNISLRTLISPFDDACWSNYK